VTQGDDNNQGGSHKQPNLSEARFLLGRRLHIGNRVVHRELGGDHWKTFRHSFRSWLDQTDAPIGVQRELMRHASIQTTMNVYGRAMTDGKRQAHGNVVEMILKPAGSPTNTPEAEAAKPAAVAIVG
jgi:integrase